MKPSWLTNGGAPVPPMRRTMALALAGLLFARVVPSSAASRTFMWFGGKAISFRSFFGVGYRKGLRTCDFAFRRWAKGGSVPENGAFPMHASRTAMQLHSGAAIYRELLTGAFNKWARGEAIKELVRKWHVPIDRYVSLAAVQRCGRIEARLESATTRLLDGVLMRRWKLGQYRAESVKLLGPSAGEIRYAFASAQRYAAVGYCDAKAVLPTRRGGRLAIWFSGAIYGGLEPVVVACIAKKRRHFFQGLCAERFGPWRYVIVAPIGPGAASVNSARALVTSAARADGTVDLTALAGGNRVLAVLGSPTLVRISRGGLDEIAKASGTGLLLPGETGLPQRWRGGNWPALVDIFQRHSRCFAKSTAAPGGFVFTTAQNRLVKDAIKAVLAKCRLNFRIDGHAAVHDWTLVTAFAPYSADARTAAGLRALRRPVYVLPGVAWPRVLMKTPWRLKP